MILLRAVLLSLLVFAGQVMTAGAASSKVKVTVKITTTGGTVWGMVHLSYSDKGTRHTKTCGKAKCTVMVPQGVKLKLKETATNSATWPFKGWVIRSATGTKHSKATTVSWHATAAATIQAVYTLPSSGGSGYSP